MPNLSNLSPSSTFPYLLQIDGGLDITPKNIEDGDGTDLPIKISNSEINFQVGITCDNIISFRNESSGTSLIGFRNLEDGGTDSYYMVLPGLAPTNDQFLKCYFYDDGTAYLSWDTITGNALLLSGDGTVTTTLKNVTDKAATASALFLATNKAKINGTFECVGGLTVYRTSGTYGITIECDNTQTTSYRIILPTAMPPDATNRMLRVSGIDVPNSKVTTTWANIGSDVALIASSNTFTAEQICSNGLSHTGGALRTRAAKTVDTATINLISTSPTIQSVNPGTANISTVNLPSTTSVGLTFFVSHSGTAGSVVIRNSDGTILKQLFANEKAGFIYDGDGPLKWIIW